jgi:5-methylcytosine-specific restriction protein A
MDDNSQGLCRTHHEAKTAKEANHYAAVNHPDWLEPSAIPLTIVCGPPASGKTTYVEDNAKLGDTVISLDDIITKLRPTYRHWQGGWDKELFNRGIRERNAILGKLKNAEYGRAWFIISAPTEAERKWWQSKLGGEIVLLHPGIDECKRRAMERGTPNAIAGIDKWERAARQPWLAPQSKAAKPTIGVDGWPIA